MSLFEWFLIWYGIGFVIASLLTFIDWNDGHDIFVPFIFFPSLLGPLLIFPLLIEYGFPIYVFVHKVFTIPGRK